MADAIPSSIRSGDDRAQSVAAALARNSVFAALSTDRLRALAESGSIVELDKGQKLFGHGDPSDAAYAVFSGEIELSIPGLDGRDVWLARIGAGAVIGEMGALDGAPRSTSAVAKRKCSLLRIEGKLIRQALLDEPDAALALVGVLSQRLRDADALVERTSSMELGKRLARFLLLEAVHGRIIYNQAEIGHHIGASREAVNRKLELWRRNNWVEITHTGLHIRDRAALLTVCKRNAKLHV
jgi:CRP-like cAMP-binding protein